MKKMKVPVQFSGHFGLKKQKLSQLGLLDPILNLDTKLFIDPLLLNLSKHIEMNSASHTIDEYFDVIIKLLLNSKSPNDIAGKTAYKKFLFHEVSGTCIGYGTGIRGSGWGPVKAEKVTKTAKAIIDLGVIDADLFMVIPLLEEGIGPDLISDMVTNIILNDLLDFNERVLKELDVPREPFRFRSRVVELPANPTEKSKSPIILIPYDILRELPVANDWEEICYVSSENDILREKVSALIGEIWRNKSRYNKAQIKEKALDSEEAFKTLLEAVKEVEVKPYDFESDPQGHFAWLEIRDSISKHFPLSIKITKKNQSSLVKFVEEVIKQYSWLIEERGLSRLLWSEANKKRVPESVAQMLFFAVADSYAKANNVDITPEADMGRGSVDFKFSTGYDSKVLVEIKFSDHNYVVSGYKNQLEIYKSAEKTDKGFYLVLDVGNMGSKAEQILDIKNQFVIENGIASELIVVDCEVKPSASKVH